MRRKAQAKAQAVSWDYQADDMRRFRAALETIQKNVMIDLFEGVAPKTTLENVLKVCGDALR